MMSKRLKPINLSTSFIKLTEPGSASKMPSLGVFKPNKNINHVAANNTGFVTERSLQQATAAAA